MEPTPQKIVVRTAFRPEGRSILARVLVPLRSALEWLVEDARAWCQGRHPWLRVPLLLWGAWILFASLRRPDAYRSLFNGLNFGIHELGHLFFAVFGQFIGVAGGTIAECSAPLLVGLTFWFKQRDYFAVSFCALWFGTCLFGVATYLADATSQDLPLVSPFPGVPIHDWNYMLGRLGLLGSEGAIAFLVRAVGAASMLLFLVAGSWLLFQMKPKPLDPEAFLSE